MQGTRIIQKSEPRLVSDLDLDLDLNTYIDTNTDTDLDLDLDHGFTPWPGSFHIQGIPKCQ